MKKEFVVIILLIIISTGCSFTEKCETDYELIDGKCEKHEYYDPYVHLQCQYGYFLENDICVKREYSMPITSYECPVGYLTSGFNKCRKGIIDYSKCSYGSYYSNGYCYPEIDATEKKTCIVGTLNYNQCVKESYRDPNVRIFCLRDDQLTSDNRCLHIEYGEKI